MRLLVLGLLLAAASPLFGGTPDIVRRNYIDELVLGKMQRDHVPHAPLSGDTEFLRRITLDLTGRLPEPEAIRKFTADQDPSKREKLIDGMMATKFGLQIEKLRTPFIDRWAYFFGELFRNGTAQQGMGRNMFHDYIYDSLLLNLPYNEMVEEMITAKTRSNWRDGPSNLLIRDHVDGVKDFEGINDEDSYDEMAITTTKLFLGVNLECISCHDGARHLEKINLWLAQRKRTDLWRQASFFSRSRVFRPYSIGQEFGLLDDGTGYDLKSKSVVRMERYPADVSPHFLLTGEQPAQGQNWRAAYARMITSNAQFPRTIVNLIWAELMGAGIVDPPLDFDLARQDPKNPPPAPWTLQPSNPELLDALAKDFVEHHYDLRYLIRTIVTSSTYQLSSHFEGEWKERYGSYFARHTVRRLSPEQVCDAIQSATGVFEEIPIAGTTGKVSRVMQSRSPEDLSGEKLKPMQHLLIAFGQNNRDKGEKETGGSTVQASVLMNSQFVKSRIRPSAENRMGKLLAHNPPLSNGEIVEEMFLAFCSRYPNPEEKKAGIEVLEKYHDQGLEDLAWSLVNKAEFILNN
ncbi:MAG TPA: DUF1553 domain-containing protein [Bryobacteraceae bacterium]|nr:DUF1553 domain-containing protein [Bryobacteraceae bacterium]